MNMNAKRGLITLSIALFTAMPVLAFAQVDNEGAEGNCNDEMSESMGCGNSSSGSYVAPSAYSYASPSTSYAPSSYHSASAYPSTSYTPTYQTYRPSYQTYQPTSYSSYGTPASYSSYPYTTGSYQIQGQTHGQYGIPTSYQPSYYGTSMNAAPIVTPQYYLTQPPSTRSVPTGTYSGGQQLCQWSDYPTPTSCGSDPQQWLYDPYSGQWY